MHVFFKRLYDLRRFLEYMTLPTIAILIFFFYCLFTVVHPATGQVPQDTSWLMANFGPAQIFVQITAIVVLIVMFVPEIFHEGEKNLKGFFIQILKLLYWIFLWLVWVMILYLSVIAFAALFWILSVL